MICIKLKEVPITEREAPEFEKCSIRFDSRPLVKTSFTEEQMAIQFFKYFGFVGINSKVIYYDANWLVDYVIEKQPSKISVADISGILDDYELKWTAFIKQHKYADYLPGNIVIPRTFSEVRENDPVHRKIKESLLLLFRNEY